MPQYLELGLFVVAAIVQTLALASVAFTRLAEGCPAQCAGRRLFYVCLLLVGCGTLTAVSFGSLYWLSFSATLATMGVGATIDLQLAETPG